MDNGDIFARPDRPRELVALIQRRSLAVLPVWIAVAFSGGALMAGVAHPGHLDPVLLVYAAGFLLMWWLQRLHRRWYGDARASEQQRARGVIIGLALFGALVAAFVLGPRVVPSPVPFVFAFVIAAPVVWEPWRVSLHWLVPAIVLLWLSVMHVVVPGWSQPGIESLATGLAGAFAAVVDHVLLLRRIRHAPGAMVMGGQHA